MSAPNPATVMSPIEKCQCEQRNAAAYLITPGSDPKQALLWMSDWLAEELILEGLWGE